MQTSTRDVCGPKCKVSTGKGSRKQPPPYYFHRPGLFSCDWTNAPVDTTLKGKQRLALSQGDRYVSYKFTRSADEVIRDTVNTPTFGRIGRLGAKAKRRRKRPFEVHTQTGRAEYNGLNDECLASHWQRRTWNRNLVDNCLVTKKGAVLPEAIFKKEVSTILAIEDAVQEAIVEAAHERYRTLRRKREALAKNNEIREDLKKKTRTKAIRENIFTLIEKRKSKTRGVPTSTPAKESIFDCAAVRGHISSPPMCRCMHPAPVPAPSLSNASLYSTSGSTRDDDMSSPRHPSLTSPSSGQRTPSTEWEEEGEEEGEDEEEEEREGEEVLEEGSDGIASLVS